MTVAAALPAARAPSPERLAPWALASLVYTVFVILFGAWVRISGSGDGCGDHWPTCQGEVVHVPRAGKTAIELTHRLTSGLCLPLVLALGWAARRALPAGHLARRAAAVTIALMVVEALIGAALVKLRLVGTDASAARALVIGLHLVNTCALTAAQLVTWRALRAPLVLVPGSPPVGAWLAAAGFLVVAALGSVTALGDTLFPMAAGESALAATTSATAHFLVRLRVVHPLLAVALATHWLWLAVGALGGRPAVDRAARLVLAAVAVQVGLGLVNVALSAPAWMQIAHLAGSTVLWLALIALLVERQARGAAGPGASLADP